MMRIFCNAMSMVTYTHSQSTQHIRAFMNLNNMMIPGYYTIMPGVYQSALYQQMQPIEARSKRHQVAKLKRQRRKDGKKTIIK